MTKNIDDQDTSTESDPEMESEMDEFDSNGNNQFGVAIQKI